MRAKPSDLPLITLAVAGLAKRLYPGLLHDARLVRAQIEARISSATNYVGHARDAVLVSTTQDIPFAERRMSVLDVIAGKSLRGMHELLTDYTAWLDAKPIIRFAMFAPAQDLQPGMRRLLVKHGFELRGGIYHRWRK